MSYSKEAIADTPSANPNIPPPTFKEERIINPRRTPKPVVQTESGQPDKDVGGSEEPKPPVESVTLSPQMAALARKEQKTRQYEQKLKEREVALEKERLEIAEFKAMKEKLATKDYSAVENLINYDEYTKYLIEKSGTTTPEQEALKKLQTEVEDVKKAHQEDVSKRFEAAVADRRNAVNTLVDANPEFASIKKLKMQEAVVQHILDTWEHDNAELSPEQAAKEVRDILKEKAAIWASVLDEAPKDPVDEKKQLPPLKPAIKTLTNQMTTGEIKRPVKSFQHMSDAERWAEARRRAEEKLKGNIK